MSIMQMATTKGGNVLSTRCAIQLENLEKNYQEKMKIDSWMIGYGRTTAPQRRRLVVVCVRKKLEKQSLPEKTPSLYQTVSSENYVTSLFGELRSCRNESDNA